MITNSGKNILAKYLIGQASSYASYIAIGCGAKPLDIDENFGNYSSKTELDFEMIRAPIISRGYVVSNDKDSFGNVIANTERAEVVLTAELPSEERYEITEIGVFSAVSNPSAGSYDSKTMYTFTQSENWQSHSGSSSSSIRFIDTKLNGNNTNSSISDDIVTNDTNFVNSQKVFQANATNTIFEDPLRFNRYEKPRFLNNAIFLRGDLSAIDTNGVVTTNTDHIHLIGTALTLDKNSPTDKIKLAFSVVNKTVDAADPARVQIVIKFSTSDNDTGEEAATFYTSQTTLSSRYFVVEKQLKDLASSGFSWSNVNVIKIYVKVTPPSGGNANNYYVCLDAMRFDNVTTENPLYGMTGYTVVKTLNALPITKEANTSNAIEFRFRMDI